MITESMFLERMRERVRTVPRRDYDLVTGPGRSGAIAAVYVSHELGIPFVPYKHRVPGKRYLIVDTVTCTGKTMSKAVNWYSQENDCLGLTMFETECKVPLWFERKFDA